MQTFWSKQLHILLISFLLIALSTPVFAKNTIEGLRIWPSPNTTRLVFDLANTPEYSYFTLNNPQRLVIDIENTPKNFDFKKVANDSKLVRKVRYSTAKNPKAVRVVIELNKKIDKNIFALPPTEPYGNRLVIVLNAPESATQKIVLNSKSTTDRDIIIVIDAGHGGEDPGSIGPSGSYEKNVTLGIAKLLQSLINKEKGMKALMTRTGDYYISPNKRPQLARKHKADMFVSIHADAFTTPQPRGASVWVLSMKRANTELGRWLERTERHSELLGGAAEIIQDTANERYLAQTFLDMSMDHSLTTSYDVSRDMIRHLGKVTKLHKKTPQGASFAVLTSPDIPSILVEMGFISNPQEEKNLNWSEYRQKLAQSVFNGLKQHFKGSPPDGSLWAKWKQEKRTHRVRSGESLSLLAQRYNVQISTLKKANNLNTDVVRIGQVLMIPST
ncbi:N-acetylmuramoyl-L-alanine amidase [Paraglaciecola psychrophila]|uniref:N-acetylmuramoyl-L-alanine amidase AmiC n=1 Tax=Paraglaciecola psychrophila 170 TaxID=1129794 RepID=K6Z6F2_9ALTE|nr:N-acetylmuramoyl-L-alanine amidase [Paraglaciecola psychrophila]AGH42504.1 cell wall hydrolase/autolysin [Paraglaciecola psychrophila 170]GAC40664.1 N-acetylmuramoyl-L-alanine amidase AmiC [Paraglaciecola psychrophila 170]